MSGSDNKVINDDRQEKDQGLCTVKTNKIVFKNVPWGALVLNKIPPFICFPKISYRVVILVLTFLTYTNYHMTRKAFSAVKSVLAPNCSDSNSSNFTCSSGSSSGYYVEQYYVNPAHEEGWKPFTGPHCKTVLGSVDYFWLFFYAIFMFFSGVIGDRMNLRYFLTFGLIGSGIGTCLLGVAYFAKIHHLYYFALVQIFNGILQSTGWPGVVAVMGNWFGKQGRGFLMGIWNSHTSVGNILGTIIPAIWAQPGKPWGWSFLVPGFIMIGMGVVVFLFLVTDPTDVGLDPPKHHKEVVRVPTPSKQDSYPSTPVLGNGHNSNVNGSINDEEKKPLLSNVENNAAWKPTHSRKSSIPDVIVNSSPYKIVVGGKEEGAIGLLGAFLIPGVIEFALSLFFAKLVAYTFLFWLPYYVKNTCVGGKQLSDAESNYLSTFFDVGGIIGGISAGLLSDISNARAITCTVMLYLSVPAGIV